MATNGGSEEARWVPALVLGGETTPEQRARNYALYSRLRDGTPEEEKPTTARAGVGLHVFAFEVPLADCKIHTDSVSFRLTHGSECHRRLLSYISDHFPTKCDADEEVKRLTDENRWLRDQLDAMQANLGGES